MEVAARVIALVFDEHHTNARTQSQFDGETLLLSAVLQMPLENLTGEKLQFRQKVDAIIKDRSMAEILSGALDGSEPAHNIARVGNGKMKGGTRGENRRAYAQFVGCHFKEMNHIFGKWDKLQKDDPGEFSKMTAAIRVSFLGGPLKITEKGRPVQMKPLPRTAVMLIESICKEYLRG